MKKDHPIPITRGSLPFTIESRIVRELGERLVKQPEVALLELVKNSYDADATRCTIGFEEESIVVKDDGHGMTFEQFRRGWMRVGTSAKEQQRISPRYGRTITGEKGIGRFAVRFLGRELELETISIDPDHGSKTKLTASFDWHQFDINEDLGRTKIPYYIDRVADNTSTGTKLTIRQLRDMQNDIDVKFLTTGSLSILTPYRSLLRKFGPKQSRRAHRDPGFSLILEQPADDYESDLAKTVLDAFVFKINVEILQNRLKLTLYRKGNSEPQIRLDEAIPNKLGHLFADIRFFPQREGTFTDLNVDGRRARRWAVDNSGIAVFDRGFRVHPYGLPTDDWLQLAADNARNIREPRSLIAQRHFQMTPQQESSTKLNYMLRLPYSRQLIGVVQVEGHRVSDESHDGLVAAADREGFVENAAYAQLWDVIRGAVEIIAFADRELQQETEQAKVDLLLKELREQTTAAIEEIESNPALSKTDKARLVRAVAQTQSLAEQHKEIGEQRRTALEIMSLLGVVAGFMTHEFGAAIADLERGRILLESLNLREPKVVEIAKSLATHVANLREFVRYSQGYVRGATTTPSRPYAVRPRLQQVVSVFGHYARARRIEVEIDVDQSLLAPLIPVALYNGIAQNLFANALKAVVARATDGPRRIAFRAWNENKRHCLEVSDTGTGIPAALRERVFDPLFTTTQSNRDPLGSGMGRIHPAKAAG